MFSGIVIKGDGKATEHGFPTANINITKQAANIDSGVYACSVTIDKNVYKGSLCVHDSIDKLEVHIMDFSGGDLYGQKISVEPHKKISDCIPFTSVDALKDKIKADVEAARGYFE